ncbi:translocation protein TolB [Robertmurraya korlensis]|uniref:TolB family protein n=1 Tax=Robertmurraya korlensis TaxID=519977 RepID=UPI00203B3AC5|nr:translocation protein TolB [Robertmurraya korlensis]MCM3601012.1 translocation protein TolB [Robertmurraya korlensis]
MKCRMVLLLLFIFFFLSENVSAEIPLTAAFVRDNQLWLKQGDIETKLTHTQYVYSPKWSYDGRYIAYIDGDEQGGKSDLFIYDMEKKESYQPYIKVEATDFKWSPIRNQLAYNDRGLLNVTKMKDGRPHGFENVSLGVSGFEWSPNGKEFIVSSQSNLLPTGWGPIELFRIPVDANLKKEKMAHFYTIQTNDDLFAISADNFKWSHDGKWVSFIGVPTASWSMDSNSLCVISSEGKSFQEVGKMLGFADWFKWAPIKNQLAYISGEGRFFVENKGTKIAEMPVALQQKEYTPKGYVDLDLEWYSPEKVIVARAKENKDWKEGPVPTMFTNLYLIDINSNAQKQLTSPGENIRDQDPQVINQYVTWVRYTGNELKGDVWVKDGLDGKEQKWISIVDYAPEFYTRDK